jgi:hypothetical protein
MARKYNGTETTEEAIKRYKKMINKYIRPYKDKCPECGEQKRTPMPHLECTLNKPLWIVIPPGGHIHINCPIHGSHRINGPMVTWYTDKGTI